jgi:hypothetical protein
MNPNNEIWQRIFKKKPEVISRSIAGETLLVPISGKLADMQNIYSLNPVAALIWMSLDGENSLSHIRNEIINNFEASEDLLEADIIEFIHSLLQEDLIT